MRSWTAALFFVVALVTARAAAAADAPATDPIADAKAHARHATQLFDLGKYLEAAKEYEQSFALSDRAPLLFNVAQAYRLGHAYKESIAAYRGFLRRTPDSPLRVEAQGRIDEMERILKERDDAERLRAEREALERDKHPQPPPPDAKPAGGESGSGNGSSGGGLAIATPAAAKQPVYKKWWLWTAVGVVVAGGVGVGVGLALTRDRHSGQTNFPIVTF
jgi:tetratricopeptide (TPR) repeat protein